MARKAKAGAAPKAPTIPASILDQLLDIPEDNREAGIKGLALAFSGQGMTEDKLRDLLNERLDSREHEELLKGLAFKPDDVLGALPDSVTDILESDATKRFVLTLRFVSDDDGERYVLTPSIQTARGRKAKGD